MSVARAPDGWDYAGMLGALRARRRFAYTRYCDGEWNAIFGRVGKNCDGHTYFPDMGRALLEAFRPEPAAGYHVGLLASLLREGRWWASGRTIALERERPLGSWCDAMILHRAGMRGELGRFFEALRGRPLAVVGNRHLAKMRPWLGGGFDHIVVPERDCWGVRERVLPEILRAARSPGVVLLACSMPARVWIRRAWEAGGEASLIDVGAVFDPYVGIMSRGYMREGRFVLAERLF